jgi:hypothetical protein
MTEEEDTTMVKKLSDGIRSPSEDSADEGVQRLSRARDKF